VVAEYAETLSPPSSWASEAHSGSQVKTLSAATAGSANTERIPATAIFRFVLMFVLEFVGAVRAQAEDVLEKHLVVGCVRARLVLRDLQTDAAELARAPVDHHGVPGRVVLGEYRKVRGRKRARIDETDARRAGAQPVVAIAYAPHRDELIDALEVPAGLRRRVAAGLRSCGRGVVECQAAFSPPLEVLALELEVRLRRVEVRRPLQDAAQRPQLARSREAVRDRRAGGVDVVVGPVLRRGREIRQ